MINRRQLTRGEEKDQDAEGDEEIHANGVLGGKEGVSAFPDGIVNLDELSGVDSQSGDQGGLVGAAGGIGKGNPGHELELEDGKDDANDAGRDDETIGGASGCEGIGHLDRGCLFRRRRGCIARDGRVDVLAVGSPPQIRKKIKKNLKATTLV